MNMKFYATLLCYVLCGAKSNALIEADRCTSMHIFDSRHGNSSFLQNAIPALPNQICSSEGEYTCCDKAIEKKLVEEKVMELQIKIKTTSTRINHAFTDIQKRFDDYFMNLIEQTRRSLHQMFIKTYGDLYSENSAIFMQMLKELKVFYREPSHDVSGTFDTFFTGLMQRMFKLIHSNRNITDNYLLCIADNMETLQLFDYFPQKLPTQIQRSFGFARSFVRALDVAKSVSVSKFLPSKQCKIDLLRMTSCPTCRGLPSIGPCRGVCLKVANGCLADFSRLSEAWNQYTDAMRSVLLQLEGPNNMESTVLPLDVKLSDIVMALQSNQDDISKMVFRFCGEPPINPNATPRPSGSFPMDSFRLKTTDEFYSESDAEESDDLKRSKRSTRSQGNPRSRNFREKLEKKMNKLTVAEEDLVRPHLTEKGPLCPCLSRYDGRSISPPGDRLLASLNREMNKLLTEYEDSWGDLASSWCDGVSKDDSTCWDGEEDESHGFSLFDVREQRSGHVNSSLVQVHVNNLKNTISQLNIKHVHRNNDDEDNEGFDYSDGSGEGSTGSDGRQFEETPVNDECEACGSSAVRSNISLVFALVTFYWLRNT